MKIIGVGPLKTVAEVDNGATSPTWRSAVVTDRSPEVSLEGGFYRLSTVGVTVVSPGAGLNMLSMRFGTLLGVAAIRRFTMTTIVTTAGTAATMATGAYVARNFIASDTSGTAISITANSFKSRTSMPPTQLVDARFGNNGSVTAGTRTLDTQPFLDITNMYTSTGVVSTGSVGGQSPGDYPIVLRSNEGIVVQNVNAMTSVVYSLTVVVEWAEFPVF